MGGHVECFTDGWQHPGSLPPLSATHCHAMVEDCLRHGETERIAQRVHDTAMRFHPELLA